MEYGQTERTLVIYQADNIFGRPLVHVRSVAVKFDRAHTDMDAVLREVTASRQAETVRDSNVTLLSILPHEQGEVTQCGEVLPGYKGGPRVYNVEQVTKWEVK